jgi:hypothetical protein
VFCVAADDTTAQLRILLVDPAAHGYELVVGWSISASGLPVPPDMRGSGYGPTILWVAARRIYLSRGVVLVEEEPHDSFGGGPGWAGLRAGPASCRSGDRCRGRAGRPLHRLRGVDRIVRQCCAAVAAQPTADPHAPTREAPADRAGRALDRRRFDYAAITSALVWAIGYTALAVTPSFAVAVLHRNDALIVGAPAGLLLIASAAVQPPAARRDTATVAAVCLIVALAGLGALASVPVLPSAGLLVAALLLLGVGHGLAFIAALREATAVAAPNTDAATTATFLATTYLGGTLPVLPRFGQELDAHRVHPRVRRLEVLDPQEQPDASRELIPTARDWCAPSA